MKRQNCYGLFFARNSCTVSGMEAGYLERHPRVRDALSFALFIALVFVGTLLINTFLFRSFAVSGHSMEHTLQDGDRLIVNRLPITGAQLANKTYMPNRGEIIVFKNPRFVAGQREQYLVKRAIAFPGERVTVKDGVLTVYNNEHPEGFHPDDSYRHGDSGPQSPVSGEGLDMTVPDGTVFVCGDNRIGDNSYDSRLGLGTIPSYDIIGPVTTRIFPFNKISFF